MSMLLYKSNGRVRIWLFVLLMSSSLLSFAQDADNEPSSTTNFYEKLTLGGNFGLQFGNVTYVDISPTVGYRFTDRFTAGPGITYRYLKVRNFDPISVYGYRAFARHTIGKQLFAQTEFENLYNDYLTLDRRRERAWVPGFFVGGGLYQPIGRRSAVFISALYNLLYDNIRSPYARPWVFNVGLSL